MPALPEARAFEGRGAFRAWLERHHDRERELLVRCFKNHAVDLGLTYFQALDEALCFGWIDGVRRSLDGDSFSVRFSPRKARSKWSAVNIARATALEAEGRMRPPGLAAFGKRGEGLERIVYSYESGPRELSPAYLQKVRANARAAKFFEEQPPGYRRTSAFWIMSAKQEATRLRRLDVAIGCWEKGQLIPGLRSAGKPGPRTGKRRGGKP